MKNFLGLIITLASITLFAQEQSSKSYYPDLTTNVKWTVGTSTLTEVQTAFNNARNNENSQLSTSIPTLTFPSLNEWNAKTDGEKALWLLNKERTDRGLLPLHGLEGNITNIAQYYAQYLIDHDTFDHVADGYTPFQRMDNDPVIGVCHDFSPIGENIFYFVTTETSIPFSIERSFYGWMYNDSSSAWGHRKCILYYPYNDNSGVSGDEGFLGIGKAHGNNYQGSFSHPYNYAEIVVINVFDPCTNWSYTDIISKELSSDCIRVYPNPASQTINIDISDNKLDNINISIINIHGQELYNALKINENKLNLDISYYPKGLYFVKVNYLKNNSEIKNNIYKIMII